MPGLAPFDQRENPYRPGNLATEFTEFDESLEAEVDQLRSFVGPRASYYLHKWTPRLQDPDASDVSLNWAAFFLGVFWMAYRKLYRTMFLFLGAIIGLSIAQQFVFVNLLGQRAVPGIVNLGINVITALVCGLCGNSWYLAHARRMIDNVRLQGLKDDALRFALARQGGTSFLSAFGMLILLALVGFLLAFATLVSMAVGMPPR